jgi:hypothetical protein
MACCDGRSGCANCARQALSQEKRPAREDPVNLAFTHEWHGEAVQRGAA